MSIKPIPFDPTSFDTLHEANKLRQGESYTERTGSWISSDWAASLAGEVGEFCNLVKKLRRGDQVPSEELARELADVIIYAELNASYHGIDLAKAVVSKFNEVSQRVGSKIRLQLLP